MFIIFIIKYSLVKNHMNICECGISFTTPPYPPPYPHTPPPSHNPPTQVRMRCPSEQLKPKVAALSEVVQNFHFCSQYNRRSRL